MTTSSSKKWRKRERELKTPLRLRVKIRGVVRLVKYKGVKLFLVRKLKMGWKFPGSRETTMNRSRCSKLGATQIQGLLVPRLCSTLDWTNTLAPLKLKI